MARKQEGHWKRETDRQGFSAFNKPGLAGSLPCLFIIEGKGFAEQTPAKKEKGMLKTKFFTSLDRVFPETDWEDRRPGTPGGACPGRICMPAGRGFKL